MARKRRIKEVSIWESILMVCLDTFMLLSVMGITLGIFFMVINTDMPNKRPDFAPDWSHGDVLAEDDLISLSYIRKLSEIKEEQEKKNTNEVKNSGDVTGTPINTITMSLEVFNHFINQRSFVWQDENNRNRTVDIVNEKPSSPRNDYLLVIKEDNITTKIWYCLVDSSVGSNVSFLLRAATSNGETTLSLDKNYDNKRIVKFWKYLTSLKK